MLPKIFSLTIIVKPSQNFLTCSKKVEFTEFPAACSINTFN